MSGFTTHAGFQSFRGYTEPYSGTNVLMREHVCPYFTRATLPSGLKVHYFDGAATYWRTITRYAAVDNLAAQTIIGWINPDADIVTTAKIFEKGLTTDDHTSLSWITDGALVFYRKRATTSPTWTTATTFAPVSTWTMYAVTYDTTSTDNDPIFYKNGVAQAAPTESAAPVGAISDDSAKNIYLGSRSAGSLPFKGYLGQQWEFNVILSTQIAEIYNQTKGLYGLT